MMDKRFTMLLVGLPVLVVVAVGLVWLAMPKVLEEEIYIESSGILKYTLSDNLKAVEKAIAKRVNRQVGLDNAEWELNEVLSANVKNAMNKNNVNYSMTSYLNDWNRTLVVIVNKRMDDKWFIWSSSFQNTPSIEAEAHFKREEEYGEKKDFDNAIYEYTEALKLDPTYMYAYAERGWMYYLNDEEDRALADYAQAISLDPNYTWIYVSRGWVYSYLGQYDLAIEDFSTAIRLDSQLLTQQLKKGTFKSFSFCI